MLYTDFIFKAMHETIVEADNGLFYLYPLWRKILDDNQLYFNDISDYKVTPEEVYEVLKLEVEKRNTINSKKPAVIDWLYELITQSVEPAVLQEETEYVKNLTEYLKTNHEIKKDEQEWDKFKNS